jgi:hypothetical protein
MPKTVNPSNFLHQMTSEMRTWVQSLHQTINGNMDYGTGIKQSPPGGVNSKVFTQFDKGNGSGVLIRIAAHGASGTGATYNWAAVNVGIVINHGLLRQPVGFKIVDKDKTVDVYRTAAPDQNQITVAPTDNTASVTLYIF